MVFNGSVNSDFLKLVQLPDSKKGDIIDYAATDFITLRTALINYIKATYPLDYQNFSESDLGMMLIELVAYMGAVMSMKADMLANETFLATAKSRVNVKKLMELIGVKMKGPIASVANAKLTLNTPATESPITLTAAQRIISISSPEDGAPLNFTLYKTESTGELTPINSDASLDLAIAESESQASSVWTNLALLEGALVVQTGSFNSTDIIKRISLTAAPVIEKSVDVFITSNDSVTSGAWTQVENLFFASGGGQNFYEVSYDDNYGATIIFGDGIVANSPPAGADYTVTYRVGGGTRGNIASEVINSQVTIGQILGSIENISQATGGQDAETVEHAKKYAPLTFKRQDRLVTAEDYSSYVNSYIGMTGTTGKARAVVRDAYSSANMIDIYLLQIASPIQLQQATIPFKAEILQSLNTKKMLTDEIVIVDGVIRTLDLVLTARIDKNLMAKEELIKGKIRRRIVNYFNVNNFDFGKPLVLGDLNRYIFTIPEVRYATVDNLDMDVVVDFNEIIQLNNFTINIVAV
jgi:hypothetical protein